MKVCAQCGKVYEPTSNHQRFCSKSCKWQWWNDRKPRTTTKSYKLAAQSRLQEPTYREKQVIVGSLFGDGCLIRGNRSVRMAICHSKNQEEYLAWKRAQVPLIFHGDVIPHKNQRHLNSIEHPYLAHLYPLFYPDGKRIASDTALALVGPLALAVWYMDDGSYNRNEHSRQVTLCTEGFGREGTELIASWFAERWRITPHVQRTHYASTFCPIPKERFRLIINRSQTSRFFEVVAPHIPDCMSYKLPK
jgi:recombination protein RecA